MSISDRTLVAKIAAHERWAREPDRSAATAPARQANTDRYLKAARSLHPGLSEDEIIVRAANLRSADAVRMARARWSKKDHTQIDNEGGAPPVSGTPQEAGRVVIPTPIR